jgi:hypothetical protein
MDFALPSFAFSGHLNSHRYTLSPPHYLSALVIYWGFQFFKAEVSESPLSAVVQNSHIIVFMKVLHYDIKVHAVFYPGGFHRDLMRDEFGYAFGLELGEKVGILDRIIGSQNDQGSVSRE